MAGPFFTIVIPTRNRIRLLPFAIETALSQTFGDYEVVVSDNGTTDEAQAVVKRFGSDRLKYFRTPSELSMPDSWDFALEQARGRYITYLCDDDAVSSHLLATVSEAVDKYRAQVITWEAFSYHHQNWPVASERNSLVITPTTREFLEWESRPKLHGLFRELWPSFPVPKMLQSMCSREMVEKVKQKHGRFFFDPCPDLSTAAFLLSETEKYVHIDRGLMLSGAALESNGANQWDSQRANLTNFSKEFKGRKLLQEVPLTAFVTINMVADTLLRVKRAQGELMRDVDLDWVQYFAHVHAALERYQVMGVNTGAEMEDFKAVLGKRPAEFQKAVWQRIDEWKPRPWRNRLRQLINSSPLLRQVELSLRPRVRASLPTVIHGREGGFTNIAECARKVDGLFENVVGSPSKAA